MQFSWNNRYWNTQIGIIVVFLLIFGTFSTGLTDTKKILLQPKKTIVQKTRPTVAPLVRAKKLPDLSVSSIKITPINSKDSDIIIIKAVVENTGTATSLPSFFKIQIGGKIYPLIRVPGLAKNKKWQYKTKVNIKRQGKYRITAIINPDKKIVESDYKNNTFIKNFKIKKKARKPKRMAQKKSKPKTVVSPPPSGPTPVDEPIPSPTPTFQIRPVEVSLASQYHAQILEFDVRHEQEGYYWEVSYRNTGSEALPSWGYFIRVDQISEDGSAEMAGNEWIMGPVSPGDTERLEDNRAWQKKDDTVSLRVEMWRTVYTGNHRFITSKTIPFPMDKLSLKPLELAVQFSIDISELEIEKKSNPEYLQWRARITNTGANSPSNNRLRARAIIISNDGTEEPVSGNDRILSGLYPGASFLTTGIIAMGSKQPGMDQLRLEIRDTEKNITIKRATIPFPSIAELNAEPVYRSLRIQSSEYLGNGQWNVEVKNTGNQNVNPNDFIVTAKYYTNQSVLPESQPFYNNNIIQPGQTETIEGFGLSNENGCERFTSIDIFVYYPIIDRTYVDNIHTPDVLSATIDDVRLARSQLSWRLINRTPYPIRVTVEIESIEIWDGPKPYSNNSSWYEDAWDFVTGGMEFDTSGLQPPVKKGTATNIILNNYTLNAATSTPGPGQSWYLIDYTTLNSMIRAKCPGVNFSNYSYLFKNLRMKLSTEIVLGNVGNATGPNSNCSTARKLDRETVSEGGSRDIPAFSW